MRAISTTAILPASNRLPARTAAVPAQRGIRLFAGFGLRRSKPTLFQRCLAVHIATAGNLSALR
jgi:hypothetical protein